MTKLIAVTDEFGNTYTPTYPKRAAGLVKHGRAHYVSDDTICLVCPPLSSETEELNMTEPMMNQHTNAVETAAATDAVAAPTISIRTAVRILRTIEQNRYEPAAFWASKTAYSGVYRTAVENGWIQDGVFVTDIPEGVDGGFLSADMARIAMMAGLLIDVLSGLLPDEPASTGSSSVVDRATEERVRAIIDEEAIKASIAETFESVLQEIYAAKEDALGDIEDAIGDIKDALMDAKDESPNR